MADYIKITTANNVEIEYVVAGVGDRILARILDLIIIFGYIFFISIMMTSVLGGGDFVVFVYLCFMLPAFFYSFIFERLNNGQTPGKNIMRTRVVTLDGSKLSTGKLLLRWMMLIVDHWLMNGFVGIVAILSKEEAQRLGDMMAETTVVSLKDKSKLNRTAFKRINPDYQPTYSQVLNMSDKEVATLKRVIISRADNKLQLGALAVDQVKQAYDIVKPATTTTFGFLKTIVRDYNHYQKLAHNESIGKFDEKEEEDDMLNDGSWD